MSDTPRPALQPVPVASDAETSLRPASDRAVYDHGELIYDAGSPLDSWYEVVSGAVRACCTLADGRRHVMEFYLAGDIFGFDDVDAMHGLRMEAAAGQQTVLIRHERKCANSRTTLDPMLAVRLRSLALCRLAATRNRIATRGLLTAMERVRAFLTEMRDRLVLEADHDGRPVVVMPMESQDIADYLDMQPETLRRCFRSLWRQGVIELVAPNRITLLGETSFKLPAAVRPISLTMGLNFFSAA